jgi:hypothetical protein
MSETILEQIKAKLAEREIVVVVILFAVCTALLLFAVLGWLPLG